MRFPGVFVVEGVQETLDLLGDDFRIIPFPGMLRSTVLSTVRVGVRIRLYGQGLRLSLLFTSRCALFLVGRPMKLGIMAGVARMDSYALGSDMIKAGTAVTMHLALCSLG